MILISNGSTTSSAARWQGGQGTFTVVGTLGGATVTLQYLGPDGTTWVQAGSDAALTAAGGVVFTLHACQIRALVDGGTPSGLYVSAEPNTMD